MTVKKNRMAGTGTNPQNVKKDRPPLTILPPLDDGCVDRAGLETWIATRPKKVQHLAREFPIGTRIVVGGVINYVLGWTEEDCVITSKLWGDYDKMLATKELICVEHLRVAKK